MSTTIEFETGCGNVFADLGLPDAEDHHLKARLVQQIGAVTKERALTQAAAASMLGLSQPELSDMLRGQFRGISVETLLHHLVALDQDVDIVVKPSGAPRQPAQLNVA